MYRIMIVKSDRGVASLYQYMTTVQKNVTTGADEIVPVELETAEALDTIVEKMLNEDGFAKSDFIIVKVVDYTIDAKDYSDAEEAGE